MSAMHTDLSAARLQIPAGVANRWAMIFGGIGLLGLAATASGFFSEATRVEALSAYLVAFFYVPVSYTHLRAHETVLDIVCRLLLEKKTTHNDNVTLVASTL